MPMKRYLWGAGLLVALGVGGACAHEQKYESVKKTEQQVGEAIADKAFFADQLSLLDQKEIILGTLALQKSSNTEVRAFAQQLIDNHKQHLASVQNYADAQALSLAVMDFSTMDAVGGAGSAGTEGVMEGVEKRSEKYDEKLDKQVEEFGGVLKELSGKSGDAFNKAFLEQVRKDQERGAELIKEGLDKYRDDPSLAMLLGRSTPVFERQKQRARGLLEAID